MTRRDDRASTSPRIKKDFRCSSSRSTASRLVYLDSAASSQKPQAVLDAMDEVLRDVLRQRAPRRLQDRRPRPPSATRAPGPRSPAFIGAPSTARARVHQERHRGHQPRRLLVGPGQPARGRRGRAHRDGAPRQPRAVADAAGGARHRAALPPRRRRLHARPHRPRPPARRREAAVRSPPCRTCSARSRRSASSPTPPTPPARCAWSTARQYVPHLPTDVADARLRLLRLHRPQDVRPHRHRRAVGPRGAARGHAAVPRRRRDDPRRPPRRLDAQRASPGSSRPARRRSSRSIGLGAAVDYLDGARHGRRPRSTRSRSPPTRCARSTERFGDDITIHGPDRPAQRGGVLSFAFRDVHPHDISQILDEHGVCVRAGHHCAKPLMRRLGVGATARASLYLYNDEADVDALADALDDAAEFFACSATAREPPMPGLEDLYREIILDHYRNPRNRGELAGAAGAPGRGVQPAVRRRDRRLPRRRRTARSPTSASTARAARSASRRRR